MSSVSHNSSQVQMALLSAASVIQDGESTSAALIIAGGEPLLAHQISVLRRAGFVKFLIEVENVPGVLLGLADKVRKQGCSVEFVRSVEDLQKQVRTSDQLLVQAEGLFAQPEFLTSVLQGNGAFIATVDGREENEQFERMDLNTRWTGLAVLSAATVAALEPLPDGWNISSSLLRQAMREGVPNRLIKQSNIQHGFLRKITSVDEADELTRQILASRARNEVGLIENRVFGPIAAILAPVIWRSPSGSAAINILMLLISGASLALTVVDWPVAAICLAILAIFIHSLGMVSHQPDSGQGIGRWLAPAMWITLSGAIVVAARASADQPFDGAFAAAMLIGLAVLARHLMLPVWAQNILRSPAVIATSLLILTPLTGFATAAKCVSLAQLMLLMAAKWTHKAKP
jgi:hypothetical protein